jgi:hypothetical protein
MSTYTPVASQTLSASASSVTFSNIPQGYTDLELVVEGIAAADSGQYYVTLNSDTTYNNYSVTIIIGEGTQALSTRYNSGNFAYQSVIGWPRSSSRFSSKVSFQNYSNATTYKSFLFSYNSVGSSGYVVRGVDLWRNTAPITSITITCTATTFSSGTNFSIYGIQAGTPKAQGGQSVTTDGTYWYHTFYSSGTFVTNQALSVDYLVVAGGGAGGAPGDGSTRGRGGGGAGGYRTTIGGSQLSLTTNTTYPVIIGAGGAGGSSCANGNNSTFGSINATGGGRGGIPDNAASGGSGGGAGNGGPAYTGGSGNAGGYSPVEGYAGGNNPVGVLGGAGGGGSSAVGANASTTSGASGGAGTANSISGSSVTYAAGGAGGPTGAATGASGTANTGNGGVGAGGYSSNGGSGGSGIVIVRYSV